MVTRKAINQGASDGDHMDGVMEYRPKSSDSQKLCGVAANDQLLCSRKKAETVPWEEKGNMGKGVSCYAILLKTFSTFQNTASNSTIHIQCKSFAKLENMRKDSSKLLE